MIRDLMLILNSIMLIIHIIKNKQVVLDFARNITISSPKEENERVLRYLKIEENFNKKKSNSNKKKSVNKKSAQRKIKKMKGAIMSPSFLTQIIKVLPPFTISYKIEL